MKLLIKKVIEFIKPYKMLQTIGVFFTILYAFFSFLTPKVSEYLIDEVIPAKSYKKLAIGISIFVTICVLQPVVGYIKDRIFIYMTEKITYDIRNKLFEKIVFSKFSFFDEVKAGELISIIMNDGRSISDFISSIFSVVLKNILLIIMIIIGMIMIDRKISIIVYVTFVIFMFINLKYKDKIQLLSKKIQENYDMICSFVNQANSMIVSIKMNCQEGEAVDTYKKVTGKMKKDNINLDNTTVFVSNNTSVMVIICLGVIYGLGAYEVIAGKMTIGNVIALGLYFQLLSGPIYELMGLSINVNVMIPIFERINKYMTLEQEDIGEYEGRLNFDHIFLNNIEFSYENEKKDAISVRKLTIPNRGMVLVVGESGAGKSTLIKLLMGIYELNSGSIYYGDTEIGSITKRTLRSNISYVPQDCILNNDTVYNNIIYGVDNADINKVIEVCKKLQIHDKITSMELGYNTIITERVNLSGGEAQRIMLARAILRKTPIYILDEPMANLDNYNSKIIVEVLSELSKNELVIMISHHEIKNIEADMVINVKNGKVKE